MSTFQAFFDLGLTHILALDGFDHILFIVVLCAVYPPKAWRKVVILVTAFTLGHSVTLALAALDYVQVNKPLIELLIPITILATAISNIFEDPSDLNRPQGLRYLFASFFGLIHGLAFASDLKAMFSLMDERITDKLLAFNIGIEVGQLVVVAVVMLLAWALSRLLGERWQWWNYGLSGFSALAALGMIVGKILQMSGMLG
ncbi:HupE/UreJ family protein [Eisenibacter elegans]|jgi:hypothetical protein|uniref:HupE/UreJ family protein n=1 Tax=Eisenibacter elegans TaxID=997 RepID=UPI00042A23BA|nr:HupE/UreJ family protein [Eisenibacter elegans]